MIIKIKDVPMSIINHYSPTAGDGWWGTFAAQSISTTNDEVKN